MDFVFDTSSLAILEQAFEHFPQMARDQAKAFLRASTVYLQGEVVERTPAAQGILRQSIGATVESDGVGVLGVVGTSLAYAVPVELGTRPHMPPIAPLEQWVAKKLGISGKAGTAVARRIQWKIARYGTPAAGMFHRGFSAGRANVERLFATYMTRLRDQVVAAAK